MASYSLCSFTFIFLVHAGTKNNNFNVFAILPSKVRIEIWKRS